MIFTVVAFKAVIYYAGVYYHKLAIVTTICNDVIQMVIRII